MNQPATAPANTHPLIIAMKLLSLIKRIAPVKCPTHRTPDRSCLWCETTEEIKRAEEMKAYQDALQSIREGQ